jgi:hypothetical protein
MDTAMQELTRQVKEKADALEHSANKPCTPESHQEVSSGVALCLRMLLVIANRGAPASPLAGLAAIGIPTPVCVLVWAIGVAKNWW